MRRSALLSWNGFQGCHESIVAYWSFIALLLCVTYIFSAPSRGLFPFPSGISPATPMYPEQISKLAINCPWFQNASPDHGATNTGLRKPVSENSIKASVASESTEAGRGRGRESSPPSGQRVITEPAQLWHQLVSQVLGATRVKEASDFKLVAMVGTVGSCQSGHSNLKTWTRLRAVPV